MNKRALEEAQRVGYVTTTDHDTQVAWLRECLNSRRPWVVVIPSRVGVWKFAFSVIWSTYTLDRDLYERCQALTQMVAERVEGSTVEYHAQLSTAALFIAPHDEVIALAHTIAKQREESSLAVDAVPPALGRRRRTLASDESRKGSEE